MAHQLQKTQETKPCQNSTIRHIEVSSLSDLAAVLQECEQRNALVFIKGGANWCTPCKHIQPFYDSFIQYWSRQVPLSSVTFNIDAAVHVSEYFQVSRIPFFRCLLPSPHPILTLNELKIVSSDPGQVQRWMTNIMQKWITGEPNSRAVSYPE